MSDDAVLKLFGPEELAQPASPGQPAVGDVVEFWLHDRIAAVRGRVTDVFAGGWTKVRLEGIGSFVVAPERLIVVGRPN